MKVEALCTCFRPEGVYTDVDGNQYCSRCGGVVGYKPGKPKGTRTKKVLI